MFDTPCSCGMSYEEHEYTSPGAGGGPIPGWCAGWNPSSMDEPRDAPQSTGEEEFYRDNPQPWW